MLSLRRIKSETSLSNSTPAGHIGHVNLTTQDVSSLLSRMARLEAELKEASSSSHHKKISSALSNTSISTFRDDDQTLRRSDSVDQSLAHNLLSLPFMKTIVDIAKRHEMLGLTSSLEDELIFSLSDAIQDSSSPWSKLVPTPPIIGPRTQDNYISAIDMVITARKEAQNGKRFAKYWKNLALQATLEDVDVPLTPSPSDISDTGLSEVISSSRDDRLKELIAKRYSAIVGTTILQPSMLDSHNCSGASENITCKHILEAPAKSEPSCLAISNSSSDRCLLSNASESCQNASVNDVDQTLVDIKAIPSEHSTKYIHYLIGQKVIIPSSTSRNSKLPRHSPARKQLMPSRIKPEPAPSINNRAFSATPTSVQAKRSMYESLAAGSSPTSGGALLAPSNLASGLKKGSTGCAPLAITSGSSIPRRMPLKPSFSPRALALSQTNVNKATLRTQLGVTSIGSSRRNSQLKSLILSQTHRGLENKAHPANQSIRV